MAAHVEISFVRRNLWPAGVRYRVLWNGTIAANGDGLPNANPAAPVNEDSPLSEAIPIWPKGKAGVGDEPIGDGVIGEPANFAAGYGAGDGAVGDGEAGLHGNRVTWSTRSVLPALRDGSYTFAVRLEDELGNVQAAALATATILVAGVPRPPTGLRYVGYSNGAVQLAWRHSPDLLTS